MRSNYRVRIEVDSTMFRVIRKWWPERDGQIWLRVELGHWRELQRWPRPGSIFQWHGYLPRLWYFLQCAIWKRHDRLEIPTLSPTWNEWDDKLLHAAMAIFCDYMRVDSPGRWAVADLQAELAKPDDDGHSHDWCRSYLPTALEMEAIYQWWTVQRAIDQQEERDSLFTWHDVFEAAGGLTSKPTDNPRLNELIFAESAEADRLHDLHRQIELRNEARDEEMLIRVMKIRRNLWT